MAQGQLSQKSSILDLLGPKIFFFFQDKKLNVGITVQWDISIAEVVCELFIDWLYSQCIASIMRPKFHYKGMEEQGNSGSWIWAPLLNLGPTFKLNY